MIVGAAFCPHPPALVPDMAGVAAGELADLRRACAEVIGELGALGKPLVLLGAGPESGAHAPPCRGSLAGYGLAIEVHLGAPASGGDLDLPLSLTIGAWLVREALGLRSGARGFSIGPDFAAHRASAELLAVAEHEDVSLLVMGDGSARRSEKAPGYWDERAVPFDAAVSAALASGDAAALLDVDAGLGGELLAAGVGAWHAAAQLLGGGRYDAVRRYDAAPYGVGYFVARWLPRA